MKRNNLHNRFIIKYLIILCIGFSLLCGSLKSIAQSSVSSKSNTQSYSKALVGVVEIVGNVDTVKLFNSCKEYHVPLSCVYRWHNHFVIYTNWPPIPSGLVEKVKQQFAKADVRLYYSPFYNFNRSGCGEKNTSKNWDNIILTANLVADPKKQAEYLEYHRTQFEKWPEVSQGFCNASFQQLLVFKTGRQLMLIISIPKGESLDKLNPLTSKNNPRVDEWNKIMSKYQEGIPGTKKGETWVFLKNKYATN